METMDVVTSDEEMEALETNKEIEGVSNEGRESGVRVTDDCANSPILFDEMSSAKEVHEDMQVKLQIGNKHSKSDGLELTKTSSPTSRGDGVTDQKTFKSKDAIPSTSKVVVRRRVRKPRARDILRPILPRRSKEKAKQMLKIIAGGIIIPSGVIFKQNIRKRSMKRTRRPNMKVMRNVKNRKMSKSSLQTVWIRDRDRRRSRSADSFRSESSRCCRCGSHQYF